MKSKCSQCGEILEKNSSYCSDCGVTSHIDNLKTVEKIHSSYSIASLVIGCFIGSLFLWITQVIFYRIPAVIDAFAGRYVLRDTIAFSIDGFFILLAITGLVLGFISIKRKRTSLSILATILNGVIIIAGSFRLFILLMVAFVF